MKTGKYEKENITMEKQQHTQFEVLEDSAAEKQHISQLEKKKRIKATFYLDLEDILAIDRMQTEQLRKSGKKPERSHIVSQAIQSLLRQENC